MSIDCLILAQTAVEVIKPVLAAGSAVVASAAGCAVWDWVKQKLGNAGRARVVAEVEEEPTNDVKWKLLAETLADILGENPPLVEELTQLLSGDKTQSVSDVGAGAKIAQVMGDHNDVSIG